MYAFLGHADLRKDHFGGMFYESSLLLLAKMQKLFCRLSTRIAFRRLSEGRHRPFGLRSSKPKKAIRFDTRIHQVVSKLENKCWIGWQSKFFLAVIVIHAILQLLFKIASESKFSIKSELLVTIDLGISTHVHHVMS